MTFPRYLFMATCCSGSTFLIGFLSNGEGNIDPAKFPTPWLFIIPFLVLLVIARVLRGRGKWSESWAFLTYGSWLIVPALLFFVMGIEPVKSVETRMIYTFSLALFVGCATAGTRAALRDRWGQMGGWWIGTILLTYLTVQCLYTKIE